ELHRGKPLLSGLTPAIAMLERVEDIEGAIAQLGLPLVLQRSGPSGTPPGWPHNIGHTPNQARQIAATLLKPESPAQEPVPPVLARQWVDLRYHQTTPAGLPLGREFRVVLHNRDILTYGYAWPHDDPNRWLTIEDEEALFAVAIAVAERLDVPLLGVDIAQVQSGEWIALKTVDPQFLGSPQMPLVQFWQAIAQIYGTDDRGTDACYEP
ncbi:MAG: hypothetical protein D6742_05930, partial [Cyanobacteria bacterium J069]